ncbi:MAG: valine--pyruvate transaminase [Chloroflexi bacterium]|nr:valine--pyruvate transaminase [Chloroflexota bacterium]
MRLSSFGKRFTSHAGILDLMKDLGQALATAERVYMMGGGNPSYIPEVQQRFRASMERILQEEGVFERMIGNYAPPQGEMEFIRALADLLRREYGWPIGPENIALTNGSQNAFFFLFNMFAGVFPDGSSKKILFPLTPEYIGYADVGLSDNFFVTTRPEITFVDDHTFKYHIDFDALPIGEDVGAICVSRPTNPTGNVLTDEEVQRLSALAHQLDVPLILDNAYGTPFPHIIFREVTPFWDDHVILLMSLSKLGLPGPRTGIIIAREDVIQGITALNAITNLTPNSVGAYLARELVASGEIIELSRDVIRPYYQRKAEQALEWVHEALDDLPFYVHVPEGAFFLWLWFKDLPITSRELYNRLKEERVIVVPGEYFFPGFEGEWAHMYECIRMNYAQDEETVRTGIRLLSQVVHRVYEHGK